MLGFNWLWLLLSTFINVLKQEWFTELKPRRSTVLTLPVNAKAKKCCLLTYDKLFVGHQRWQTKAKLSWISSSYFRHNFFSLCKIIRDNFYAAEKLNRTFSLHCLSFVGSMLWNTNIFNSSRRVQRWRRNISYSAWIVNRKVSSPRRDRPVTSPDAPKVWQLSGGQVANNA